MPFNFCPKRDASFWENGSELKRFVLELQTGGFADYTCLSENMLMFFLFLYKNAGSLYKCFLCVVQIPAEI